MCLNEKTLCLYVFFFISIPYGEKRDPLDLNYVSSHMGGKKPSTTIRSNMFSRKLHLSERSLLEITFYDESFNIRLGRFLTLTQIHISLDIQSYLLRGSVFEECFGLGPNIFTGGVWMSRVLLGFCKSWIPMDTPPGGKIRSRICAKEMSEMSRGATFRGKKSGAELVIKRVNKMDSGNKSATHWLSPCFPYYSTKWTKIEQRKTQGVRLRN